MDKENDQSIFVIMPSGGEFDDIFKVGIEPAIGSAGVRRWMRAIPDIPILEGSWLSAQLSQSDIVVFDVSIPNVNLFYAMGIISSLGIHLITIAQGGEHLSLPSQVPYIKYENTRQGLLSLSQTLSRLFKRTKIDSKLRTEAPQLLESRMTQLRQERDRLKGLLAERDREIERIKTASPGAAQLVAFRENLEAMLGERLDKRVHELEQALADANAQNEELLSLRDSL